MRTKQFKSVEQNNARAGIIDKYLRAREYTSPQMAKLIGISESGFYQKKKQPSKFTIREFHDFANSVSMSDEDIVNMVRGRI